MPAEAAALSQAVQRPQQIQPKAFKFAGGVMRYARRRRDNFISLETLSALLLQVGIIVSSRTLHRYEHGLFEPPGSVVFAIAFILRRKPEDLVVEIDPSQLERNQRAEPRR